MGGRGASSSISSYKWNGKNQKYGDEYTTILQHRNIKFIVVNEGATNSPLETKTKGRVYVTINKKTNKPHYITYYDYEGKRKKSIDLEVSHKINGEWTKPHTHLGYEHNDNGKPRKISNKELKMIEKVNKIWNEYINR